MSTTTCTLANNRAVLDIMLISILHGLHERFPTTFSQTTNNTMACTTSLSLQMSLIMFTGYKDFGVWNIRSGSFYSLYSNSHASLLAMKL